MQLQDHNNKINNKVYDVIYVGILVCLFAGFVMLFYRQCIRYNDAYISDTYVYAQDIGDLAHSRMIAFILPKLYELTGGYYASAVFLALIVIATILANYMFIGFLFDRENVAIERYKIQAMSLAGLVASAIYLPGAYEHFFKYTWSRYSWQSPTQQAMILFSVLSIMMFVKIYDNYMDRIRPGQWAGLTVLLFLSAWAKPNFMMVISPVVLIVFIIDFFNRKEYSAVHRIKRILDFGMAFVPAGVFILILNHLEFDGSENSSIEIRPGFFLEKVSNVPLMIFLSIGFSLIVIIFNYKKLKDITYSVICGITVVGIAEYLLLVEAGINIKHGNFSWGREAAEYILFMAAMVLAVMNIRDKQFLADKPMLRKAYIVIIVLLFAGHLISGLVYLQFVARGHMYRI